MKTFAPIIPNISKYLAFSLTIFHIRLYDPNIVGPNNIDIYILLEVNGRDCEIEQERIRIPLYFNIVLVYHSITVLSSLSQKYHFKNSYAIQ